MSPAGVSGFRASGGGRSGRSQQAEFKSGSQEHHGENEVQGTDRPAAASESTSDHATRHDDRGQPQRETRNGLPALPVPG